MAKLPLLLLAGLLLVGVVAAPPAAAGPCDQPYECCDSDPVDLQCALRPSGCDVPPILGCPW